MITLLRPIATSSFKEVKDRFPIFILYRVTCWVITRCVLNKITTFVCFAANSFTRFWKASWLKLLCSSNKEWVTSVTTYITTKYTIGTPSTNQQSTPHHQVLCSYELSDEYHLVPPVVQYYGYDLLDEIVQSIPPLQHKELRYTCNRSITNIFRIW